METKLKKQQNNNNFKAEEGETCQKRGSAQVVCPINRISPAREHVCKSPDLLLLIIIKKIKKNNIYE